MRMAIGLAAMAFAVAASGCTYELRDEGVLASCAPLAFVINSHGAGLGTVQHDAIVDAIHEFGALVGREVDYLGGTTTTHRDHELGDPILIELVWPDNAPDFLDFANPYINNDRYDGGWMYFNPVIKTAPPGMIRRLVMHELGHMHGLGDVDDTAELMNSYLTAAGWGQGDLVGFVVTHAGGCEGSTLIGDILTMASTARVTAIDTETDQWLATTGLVADIADHD